MTKPNRLLIVGAAALGRQVLDWAMAMPQGARDWDIGGFLDDRPHLLDGFNRPFGILGDPMTFTFCDTDRVVCAIANPKVRLDYCQRLAARGAQFTNVIHPISDFGSNCRMGTGCMFGPGAGLDCDTVIGDHVLFYNWSGAGHDCRIGDGCLISAQAVVSGGCTLGTGAIIGTHATVNEHLRVGAHAFVAAGSVATRDVPDHAVVMGIPARPMRQWARLTRLLKD